MKIKKLLMTLTIAAVVLIGACKKDKFEELAAVCPVVLFTDPSNGATGVPLNQVITVTFNEEINPATITNSSFIVTGSTVPGTVSCSGSTASFTPSSPLIPNHTYTGRVTTAVRDLMGNALQQDYVWTFSTGAIMSPMVIYTDPADKATGVVLDKIISAAFNMPMDPLTINDSTFTIKQGTTLIAGTISYNGDTAYFIPSGTLKPNTLYTGTISTGAKNLLNNSMQNDYIWTFTTLSIPAPVVISTDPADNAVGVALNKIITATFNVPMDPLTLTTTTFNIKQGGTPVAGTVLYSGTMASFMPSGNLLPGTTYTANITTGARNIGSVPLANDYVWTFTTGTITAPTVIQTDPINKATDVSLNKIVTATFSESMDPTTLTPLTFTIKQGAASVAGTVTYTGSIASFTPSGNLMSGVTYTATITTGAKNPAGIPMANTYIWTFTTVSIPVVISTDPLNLATGVALNKIVTATFSAPMDPSTLNTLTFNIKQGAAAISGTVSNNGRTVSFSPTVSLLPGITYTATITTGAKNPAGTPIANDYVWTFTTGILKAPVVVSTDPANKATGVILNKTASATFSEPMDPLTLNSNTFTVKQGTTPVAGTVWYNGTATYFKPNSNLLSGTIYTATITTGAKNLAGIPLANNYQWTFTTLSVTAPTVISTNPIDNATGVVLNKIVTATFSVPMDPMTIDANTFTLKQGASAISGTVSYNGSTASFKPSANLMSGVTYTATITTGAKNGAGTALTNNYVWTFSTKAPLGPTGPDLKSVGRFGIIAGVGVSNNAGFSKINNMDVGIYPGTRSSISGFPPAVVVNGAIYASDDAVPAGVAAMLLQAKNDLTAAYLYAEGATSPAPATVSGDQGGKTLAPGIYKSTSTLSIQSGDLTLDAQGDANAVWIFQIAAAFTTVGGAGGNIILSGGAQAKNVYWQVGSSATIGGYTAFKGNILALTSITMGTYSTAVGRMLARNAAVVLTSTNTIDKP